MATAARIDVGSGRSSRAPGYPFRAGPYPGSLSEQPGLGVGDRLVLVDRYDALDDADQRPHQPPSKNRDADEHDAQRNADREVQQSDPEGPDLELVMRPQHWVGIVDLHVRDDDANQRRNRGEIARE